LSDLKIQQSAISDQHLAKPHYRKGREGRKGKGNSFCISFAVFASFAVELLLTADC